MKVTFYLNNTRQKNLYCRVSDGSERFTFSLNHAVDPSLGSGTGESVSGEEVLLEEELDLPVLGDLKFFLESLYLQLKGKAIQGESVLPQLKKEVDGLIKQSGLRGLTGALFDRKNLDWGIPAFELFLRSFEQYTGISPEAYQAWAIDNFVYIVTEQTGEPCRYLIDTKEGITERLRTMVEEREYETVSEETRVAYWDAAYSLCRPPKGMFIAKMLSEWENYWDGLETYSADRIQVLKEQSWRKMQLFTQCLDGDTGAIALANVFDHLILYPVAVMAMQWLDHAEDRYEEYVRMAFEDWNPVRLETDSARTVGPSKKPVTTFYIQKTTMKYHYNYL